MSSPDSALFPKISFFPLKTNDFSPQKDIFSSSIINIWIFNEFLFCFWGVFAAKNADFCPLKPFPAPKWSSAAPAQHLCPAKRLFLVQNKDFYSPARIFEAKKRWMFVLKPQFWVKIGFFCSPEGVPGSKMEVSSPKMEVRGKNRSFVLPNPLFLTSKITASPPKFTFFISIFKEIGQTGDFCPKKRWFRPRNSRFSPPKCHFLSFKNPFFPPKIDFNPKTAAFTPKIWFLIFFKCQFLSGNRDF